MPIATSLHHIALQYSNRSQADIFFIEILNLRKVKHFNLSPELSDMIFGIAKPVEVDVYGNDVLSIEVFFIENQRQPNDFTHVCITVSDRATFIRRCEQHHLTPFTVQKDGKEYLFVRDFSGNLFEVKVTK